MTVGLEYDGIVWFARRHHWRKRYDRWCPGIFRAKPSKRDPRSGKIPQAEPFERMFIEVTIYESTATPGDATLKFAGICRYNCESFSRQNGEQSIMCLTLILCSKLAHG